MICLINISNYSFYKIIHYYFSIDLNFELKLIVKTRGFTEFSFLIYRSIKNPNRIYKILLCLRFRKAKFYGKYLAHLLHAEVS